MATTNQGFPADRKKTDETVIGAFTFGLVHRNVEADGGLTLHIFGPVKGKEEEILRFDCFKANPHYHVGFSYRGYEALEIHSDEPFKWTIDALTTSFDEFADRAGADMDTVGDVKSKLAEALPAIAERGRALMASVSQEGSP